MAPPPWWRWRAWSMPMGEARMPSRRLLAASCGPRRMSPTSWLEDRGWPQDDPISSWLGVSILEHTAETTGHRCGRRRGARKENRYVEEFNQVAAAGDTLYAGR